MLTIPNPNTTSVVPDPDERYSREIFLGRQPILGRNQNLVAYELLFRGSQVNNASNAVNDLQATASVISRVFTEMNTQDILGKHRGFINFSADLLLSDLIELLPRKRVVLELLETISINHEIIHRCQNLKRMGYSLALDDFGQFADAYIPLLEVCDIVKIDLTLHDDQSLTKVVQQLRPWPVKLLAEKVDSQKQAARCMELGFDLFQGYYFARPDMLNGKGVDPAKLPLLRLFGLVLGDADAGEIEQIFRQSPNLTFNLLRLVNSVASGMVSKISTVKQAIMVLGRRQLQRWLQLLLFTLQKGAEYPSPLMDLAATRGRLMELLAGKLRPNDKDYQDQAFMTGLLSLLDALLEMPLNDLINQLNIPEFIEHALLNHEGELGALLALAKQLEHAEFADNTELLEKLPAISPEDLCQAQLDAMAWVNNLN
jgi:c-di-GMP-related signal transduction protein